MPRCCMTQSSWQPLGLRWDDSEGSAHPYCGERRHTPELVSENVILATLTNTGTITVENGGSSLCGMYNMGSLSNSGAMAVSAGASGDIGILNNGAFTDEAPGELTIAHDEFSRLLYGIDNDDGTMINYGTVINEGDIWTEGWAMLTDGTLHNYGLAYQAGGVLVNYVTVHNGESIDSDGYPDYPHNRGICIDEVDADGEPRGSGC